MGSSSVGAERSLRLILKVAQLLASFYLIVAMYNIGPHWILLVASLAIPLYGLFLVFRSPERKLRQHPLPYVRYKALARARSWFRVDLAICATMAIVCLAFALVLLLGYFQEHSANTFLLQGAIAALLLSLLYSLNSLLSVRQLQMGRVDFLAEKQNASVSTTRASTQSPIGEPNFASATTAASNGGHSSPYRAFEEGGWRSSQKPVPVSVHQSPPSSIERQGPSLLEQLQTELASEYARGRWRHIPIEMEEEEERAERAERVQRQVKVEQSRRTPYGLDLGAFGTREEKWRVGTGGGQQVEANGGEEPAGRVPEKMLPRLALQHRDGGSRIRGDWNGTVGERKDQFEGQMPPYPATSSSTPAENGERDSELRRTIERKRVRYETVASKTLVDVDKEGPEAVKPRQRRDFDVSIRPRTSPFRHSTELKLRDDRRPVVPHQVTEL